MWTIGADPPVVLATFDPADVPADGGLVAEVDTVSGTGSLRAVGIDEFASLSGYSIETLRTYRADFAANQALDQSVAQPEAYDPDGLIRR